MESLVARADDFDFAILVSTPDDMVNSREQTCLAPCDNVLFELGLFVGKIRRERTFIIRNRFKEIKLPSDLAGISTATFDEFADGNLLAALGAPTTITFSEIERLGSEMHKV